MAVDLTNLFSLAYEHAAAWTPDHLNAAVHAILDRIADAVEDWDASSGEEWVQFTADDAPILYLRVDYPLALILSGYEALLDGIDLVIVSVEDFQQSRYSMDVVAAEAILSPEAAQAINPDGFTVHELWRASI